jgi:hypothetical protein
MTKINNEKYLALARGMASEAESDVCWHASAGWLSASQSTQLANNENQ